MKKRYLTLIILVSAVFIAQRSKAQFTTVSPDIYYNAGKVGIGTAGAPLANNLLQVYSSTGTQGVYIGSGSYPSFMGNNGLYAEGVVRGSTILAASGNKINWGSSQVWILGYNPTVGSDTYLTFGTAATERMRIDNSGNVGIGTTTPTSKLHVVGDILATGGISGNNFGYKPMGLCVGTNIGNATGTGTSNTVMGYNSGQGITTGNNNSIIGFNVANSLTTGYRNIIIGGLSSNWNTITGNDATTAFDNVLIGNGAGGHLTTAGYCVAVGSGALLSNGASNSNTGVGYSAGIISSGTNNTFLGAASGVANSSGSNNIMIGYSAGRANTTGSGITIVGTSAGFIGSTDGLTNATAIGYNTQVTASNSVILGNGANVGIGTTAPGELLSLGKTGGSKGVLSFSGNTSGKVIVQPAAAAGTWTMTLPTTAGTSGYVLQTDGAGVTSWVVPSSSTAPPLTPGSLVFAGATGTYTQDNSNLFWDATKQTLAIGTTTVPVGYKLAIKGNVIAESVKVQVYANWADYVFDKSYKLMPLPQVESYVRQNHHLPEIPSAQEIKDKGLDLGEMNKQLVKKVEELTLYLIDKDKQITELKTKLEDQQQSQSEELKQIKAEIDKLKSNSRK